MTTHQAPKLDNQDPVSLFLASVVLSDNQAALIVAQEAEPADARSLGLDVVVGRGDERVVDPGEGAGLVRQLDLNRCRCVASRLALRCHIQTWESVSGAVDWFNGEFPSSITQW